MMLDDAKLFLIDDEHPLEPHKNVDVGLDVAVVEVGARVLGDELVGELVPWPNGFLRDVGHSIHDIGVDGAVGMDGVWEIMGIPQVNLDPVPFLHPDGWAWEPCRRDHSLPFRGKDPKGDDLARIDLLPDLDDLQVDSDLVGVPVPIEVPTQDHGRRRGPRDGWFDERSPFGGHPLQGKNQDKENWQSKETACTSQGKLLSQHQSPFY